MNEMTNWDYDESVKRVRPKVMKFELTLDVYHELWTAREALSTPAWNKRSDGTNDPPPTWAQYCEDIGLVKRTVDRWLERYDPTGKVPGPVHPGLLKSQDGGKR